MSDLSDLSDLSDESDSFCKLPTFRDILEVEAGLVAPARTTAWSIP